MKQQITDELYLVGGKESVVDFWVVLCLLCRLGFPGSLADHYAILTPLFDYGSSAIELILILVSSAESIGEIRLLDLKRKYGFIYASIGILLVQSFLVTSDKTAEFTICLRFVITFLFGLWLADRYEARRLLELIYKAQGIFVFINLLLFGVFRSYGFYYDEEGRYLFHGLMNRKNSMGEELAFGLVLLVALLCMKRKENQRVSLVMLVILAAQLFLLVQTSAVAAVATAVLPCIYIFCYDHMKERMPRFHWSYIYIVVSVGFLVAALTVLPVFAPVFEYLGKDATLSNRTTLWEEIIPFMIDDRTFTGYGLFMFWNDRKGLKSLQDRFVRNSWFRSMSYGSHNTLLEIWLDVGLIGVGLYFLMILYSFRRIKAFSHEQYLTCSALMLPLMIRGLTERSYTSSSYLTLFLFIMLGIACTGSERKTSGYPRRPFLPSGENEEERA